MQLWAVFSPGSICLAVPKGCCGVKLCRSADAVQLFPLADNGFRYKDAVLNSRGNQLVLSGGPHVHILCWGWDEVSITASKQLCLAVSVTCSRASSYGHTLCKSR